MHAWKVHDVAHPAHLDTHRALRPRTGSLHAHVPPWRAPDIVKDVEHLPDGLDANTREQGDGHDRDVVVR